MTQSQNKKTTGKPNGRKRQVMVMFTQNSMSRDKAFKRNISKSNSMSNIRTTKGKPMGSLPVKAHTG